MSYTRMTVEKRKQLYAFRQAGFRVRRSARELGVSPGTVSRELSRNTGRRGYRPRQAQEMAEKRARRPKSRKLTEEVKCYAEEKLRAGWTPERICAARRFSPLETKNSLLNPVLQTARRTPYNVR